MQWGLNPDLDVWELFNQTILAYITSHYNIVTLNKCFIIFPYISYGQISAQLVHPIQWAATVYT